MRKELGILLIADTVVDQDQTSFRLYQQAAHSHFDHVILVGRTELVPDGLGNHPEHCTSVEFEISCFDRMKSHGFAVYSANLSSSTQELLVKRLKLRLLVIGPKERLFAALQLIKTEQ
jgi:hypothetical protein